MQGVYSDMRSIQSGHGRFTYVASELVASSTSIFTAIQNINELLTGSVYS